MSLRNDRRRRLLAEEGTDEPEARPAVRLATDTRSGKTNYAASAESARQRGLHTLVPARFPTIGLSVTLALLGIVGCGLLHWAADASTEALTAEELAALRYDGPGAMSRWFASTLLGLASAVSLFIYSLRRHRIDDYHGRYRVWLWTAMACLIASLAETTDIEHLLSGLARAASPTHDAPNHWLWSGMQAMIAGAVGLRLCVEMRRSRWALALMTLAAASFATSVAMANRWPAPLEAYLVPLLSRGVWLTGYVWVLTTFLFYARHVQMEILGVTSLTAKRKKAAAKVVAAAAKEENRPAKSSLKLRTDLDPVESTPEPTKARPAEVAPTRPMESSNPTQQNGGGSRAERRRQRHESRMAS